MVETWIPVFVWVFAIPLYVYPKKRTPMDVVEPRPIPRRFAAGGHLLGLVPQIRRVFASRRLWLVTPVEASVLGKGPKGWQLVPIFVGLVSRGKAVC